MPTPQNEDQKRRTPKPKGLKSRNKHGGRSSNLKKHKGQAKSQARRSALGGGVQSQTQSTANEFIMDDINNRQDSLSKTGSNTDSEEVTPCEVGSLQISNPHLVKRSKHANQSESLTN